MIKIINKPKYKPIKCKICKTKYLYESEDIKWYAGIYKGMVTCPVCRLNNYCK